MKRKYGLVGYPLGHSFSRSFFQQKFEDEHINATYENFEIQDISCLRQLISDNHELCGLNVTIPHKTTVIPLLAPFGSRNRSGQCHQNYEARRQDISQRIQ